MITIEERLDILREQVRGEMSEKRYRHTLGVEEEISALADVYLPEKKALLRAAALLHDITKEYSNDRQLELIERTGADADYYRTQSHKLYHSQSAVFVISEKYAEWADAELLHAVSVHTAGDGEMSLFDKLLYLADYTEPTRTFEDCVTLRRYLWDGMENADDVFLHLDRTLILSFDLTIRDLIGEGRPISQKTVEARNSLLAKIKEG